MCEFPAFVVFRAGLPILAQIDRTFPSDRKAPQGAAATAEDWLWLAVLIGGPLAAMLLGKLVQHAYRRLQRRNPHLLFFELCRAHGLGWRNGLRLWRLAGRLRLESPALLFVSPQHFDAAAGAAPDSRDARQLQRLAEGLFADSSATRENGPRADKPGPRDAAG